jgi:hypothetical protein
MNAERARRFRPEPAGREAGVGIVDSHAESPFEPVPVFDEAAALWHNPGRQLDAIRHAAPDFRSWITASGRVAGLQSCDLVAIPYHRQYALWRASSAPETLVHILTRLVVVQWNDADGRCRRLLWEPADLLLGGSTPYFVQLTQQYGELAAQLATLHDTVDAHLSRLGLDPAQVDYLAFDHLHTQDVRRWLGTTRPQADLAAMGLAPPDAALEAYFPNARLIVSRVEWESLTSLRPIQRRFYQPAGFAEIDPARVVLVDRDVALGPGVALLRTPGHTLGNMSLVVNSDSGIWTSSENGVHAECYEPSRSRLPGLAAGTLEAGVEVVLNANTTEFTALQYNSMVAEKLVADRGGPGGEWPQCFPSSELVAWVGAPNIQPSFSWNELSSGTIARGAEALA